MDGVTHPRDVLAAETARVACWLTDGACALPTRCPCRPPKPGPLPAHADPRGDGLCPECPTDLSASPTGSHCIECGWTSPEIP